MPDPAVFACNRRELQEHLRDQIARNPFLTAASVAAMTRIADGAEVRVPAGSYEVRGTVVGYLSDGSYAVSVPDGRTLSFDGPALERLNPDAPRVPV